MISEEQNEKYNKTSCFELIMFITQDWFTNYANITTKLKWKLFTKVIKRPCKEAWVGQTECIIKREAQPV